MAFHHVVRDIASVAFVAFVLPLCAPALAAQEGKGRTPVPDEATQQQATQVAKDLFGEEYERAKTSAQKLLLAKKLLTMAADAKNVPADHFVLLSIARDVAVQAGEAETAFQAIDELGRTFRIDTEEFRAAALFKVAKGAQTRAQHASVTKCAQTVIDGAVARDDYETAGRLGVTALAAAQSTRNPALVKQIAAQNKRVQQTGQRHKEVRKALATLKEKPNDPAANLLAGRFYCFLKDDWERGIPMLALSGTGALHSLAARDLEGAASENEQIELGDAWWDLAQDSQGDEKQAMLKRAGFWYVKAADRLPPGLARVRVLKRIEMTGGEQPPATSANSQEMERLLNGCILLMTFERQTFGDRSGTAYVRDLSGHNHHGVVSGAASVKEGKAGSALQFDGVDDFVLLPTLRGQLAGHLRAVSISLWYRCKHPKQSGIIFDVGEWTPKGLGIRGPDEDGTVVFALPENHGGKKNEARGVAVAQWHHVVGVWNGTQQGIYVDGQLEDTQPTRGLVLNDASVSFDPARIGGQAKEFNRRGRFFAGSVDEVAVFVRALTPAEVRALYELGREGKSLR